MYETSLFPFALLTHSIPSNVWMIVNTKLEGLGSWLYKSRGPTMAWRECEKVSAKEAGMWDEFRMGASEY
jgi:hypothetical protein